MQNLNYGIIRFNDTTISGKVTSYDNSLGSAITVVINGVTYRTGINNVLLMHKDVYDEEVELK